MNKETEIEQYAQSIQDMYFLAGAKISVETWANTKDVIRNALTTHDAQLWEKLENLRKLESPLHDAHQFYQVKDYNAGITDAQKLVRTEPWTTSHN